MEIDDKNRFLIVEKEVGYNEDFIVDVPIPLNVDYITDILLSSTCKQLVPKLKHDTQMPYFDRSFGFNDFMSMASSTHPDYEKNFGYILGKNDINSAFPDSLHSPYDVFHWYIRFYIRYFYKYSLLKATDENIRKKILISEQLDVYDNNNYPFVYKLNNSNIIKVSQNSINYEMHDANKWVLKAMFLNFFDSNYFFERYFNVKKIPFTFDYARYLSGVMSIAKNGTDLILRNSRVTVNQINKTLQNNLIDIGNVNCNGDFLRCVYFSKHNNIDPTTTDIYGNMIDLSSLRIIVKIYIKYKLQ